MAFRTILLVVALICFLLAALSAFGVLGGLNALGLAFVGASAFVASFLS